MGKDPSSIGTGDFNGDGILDLAVANFSDNTVSVLLGKPDGTFAAQTTYSTGTGPVAVATGDFNGDGNMDLVVANENCSSTTCSSSGVSILLGIGDGTFQPRTDYSTGTGPNSVGVGDFNGDGKLDVVVINSVDNTMAVLLGNGDGTFRSEVAYQMSNGTLPTPYQSSIVIGDFNGDQNLDVAVCNGGLEILLGKGDGTFSNPMPLPGAGGTSMASGDFNQDGKLDLAIANPLDPLVVYLGNGDGTFSLSATYPTFFEEVVRTADFNGDGKLDLAVSGQAPVDIANDGRFSVVSILLGNGDGTFQAATPYGTEFASMGLVAGDFNGDGAVDLALTDVGSPGKISVLLGNGDGTFVARMNAPTTPSGYYDSFSNFSTGDFNNDGRLDLAIADSVTDSISVFVGNGDGTFELPVNFPTGHVPVWVVAGDFRNNGNTDLAVVNSNCGAAGCILPGSLSVLLGNGDGTFQAPVDYGVNLDPTVSALGDFRGIGKIDLAVTNSISSNVSLLLGNGDGTFQSHVDYPVGQAPGAIVTGDFNGDGKLDLVTCISGTNISVLLGNGDGTFKPHIDTFLDPGGGACLSQWGSSPIATGDFNKDGKLDLAVYDIDYQGSVFILLGNGDGTFQPAIKYPAGSISALSVVVAADFNADGNLDLAVSGTFDGRTTLLLGNGDGTFQTPVIYPLLLNADSSFSQWFAIGDFNGDGAPDWVLAVPLPNQPLPQIWVMLGSFKAVYPTALNFGGQGLGTTSAVRTITISNPSAAPIGVNGITTSGDFASNTNCGGTLKPGTNCAVNVTFSPNATGTAQGKITITDTTRSSNRAIALIGAGVDGPFLSTYPRRLSFAPQLVGAKSPVALVIVVNSGNAPASLNSINITGTNSSDFSQTSNCGNSLPLGGSCTASVTFAPSTGGLRTASLSVSDSAPGSTQTVALFGFGSGLGLAIASGGSSSVTVSAGNAATYHLTIGAAGFSGSATLNCTGAPAGTNCVVPTTVNVTTIASPLTVTVTTSSGSAAMLPPQYLSPPVPFYLICLIVLASLPKTTARKRLSGRLGQSLAIFVILLLSSCGGGSTPSLSTPKGTYQLTVKAISGSISQAVSLTLIVD